MTTPSQEAVEAVARVLAKASFDHSLPYNEHEPYRAFLARAVLSSPPVSELVEALNQHFAWLDQFAVDDDDVQRRNWRDNLMRIREQVRKMRAALTPFTPAKQEGEGL